MAEKFQQRYRIPSSRASWHNYGGGAYFVTVCTTGMHHYFGKIQNGEMILSELGEYLDECIKNITKHSRYAEIPLYVVMPNHIHLIVYINSTNAMLVETVHAPSKSESYGLSESESHGLSESALHAPSKSESDDSFDLGNASELSEQNGTTNNPQIVETVHTTSIYIGNRVICEQKEKTVHAPSLQHTQRWKSETVNENMQSVSLQKGKLSVVVGGIKSAVTKYARGKNIPFGWQTRFHERIVRDKNELNRIAEYIENNVISWKIDQFNRKNSAYTI